MAEKENDQIQHQKNSTNNRKGNIAIHLPYKNLWVQPLYRNSEGRFPIYVNLSLWVQLWQYVLNSEINQGGIFLGKLCVNQENPFCEILSFVEVSFKSQEIKRLTGKRWRWSPTGDFSQEQGETDQILGWFKTHNGNGPYLSRSDTLLHKRFFNKEGQMAVVFDKLSKECGFFGLENNQIVRNSNVSLYSSDRDLLEERLASLVNFRGKNQDEKKDSEKAVSGRSSEDWVSSTDSLLFIQLLNKSRELHRQTEKLSKQAQEPLSGSDPLKDMAEIPAEEEISDQELLAEGEGTFKVEIPMDMEMELQEEEKKLTQRRELLLNKEADGRADFKTEDEATDEYKHPLKPSEEKVKTAARTLQIDHDLAFDSALAVVSTELSRRIHRLNDRLDKKTNRLTKPLLGDGSYKLFLLTNP